MHFRVLGQGCFAHLHCDHLRYLSVNLWVWMRSFQRTYAWLIVIIFESPACPNARRESWSSPVATVIPALTRFLRWRLLYRLWRRFTTSSENWEYLILWSSVEPDSLVIVCIFLNFRRCKKLILICLCSRIIVGISIFNLIKSVYSSGGPIMVGIII